MSLSRGSSEETAHTYEIVRAMDDVDIGSDSNQETIKAPTQSPEYIEFQDEKAHLIAENQQLRQQLQEALEKLEQEKMKQSDGDEQKPLPAMAFFTGNNYGQRSYHTGYNNNRYQNGYNRNYQNNNRYHNNGYSNPTDNDSPQTYTHTPKGREIFNLKENMKRKDRVSDLTERDKFKDRRIEEMSVLLDHERRKNDSLQKTIKHYESELDGYNSIEECLQQRTEMMMKNIEAQYLQRIQELERRVDHCQCQDKTIRLLEQNEANNESKSFVHSTPNQQINGNNGNVNRKRKPVSNSPDLDDSPYPQVKRRPPESSYNYAQGQENPYAQQYRQKRFSPPEQQYRHPPPQRLQAQRLQVQQGPSFNGIRIQKEEEEEEVPEMRRDPRNEMKIQFLDGDEDEEDNLKVKKMVPERNLELDPAKMSLGKRTTLPVSSTSANKNGFKHRPQPMKNNPYLQFHQSGFASNGMGQAEFPRKSDLGSKLGQSQWLSSNNSAWRKPEKWSFGGQNGQSDQKIYQNSQENGVGQGKDGQGQEWWKKHNSNNVFAYNFKQEEEEEENVNGNLNMNGPSTSSSNFPSNPYPQRLHSRRSNHHNNMSEQERQLLYGNGEEEESYHNDNSVNLSQKEQDNLLLGDENDGEQQNGHGNQY